MKNKKKIKTNVQMPSTWHLYRKGLCEGCWSGCCTLPVEVSVTDLIRLELICEEEAAISLKQVAKKLTRLGIIQAFQQKSQLFVLEQRNGRDCIYLDQNRRCSVYNKRPEVCRRFPKIGPRPGYCPAIRFTKTGSNLENVKNRLPRGSQFDSQE